MPRRSCSSMTRASLLNPSGPSICCQTSTMFQVAPSSAYLSRFSSETLDFIRSAVSEEDWSAPPSFHMKYQIWVRAPKDICADADGAFTRNANSNVATTAIRIGLPPVKCSRERVLPDISALQLRLYGCVLLQKVYWPYQYLRPLAALHTAHDIQRR